MTFLNFLRAYWQPIIVIFILLLAALYVYTHRTQLFRRE